MFFAYNITVKFCSNCFNYPPPPPPETDIRGKGYIGISMTVYLFVCLSVDILFKENMFSYNLSYMKTCTWDFHIDWIYFSNSLGCLSPYFPMVIKEVLNVLYSNGLIYREVLFHLLCLIHS